MIGLSKNRSTELKRWHFVVLVCVVVCSLFLRWYYSRWTYGTVIVKEKNSLHVLVAKTPEQKYQGWSNRDSMGDADGMVFPFGAADTYGFVMRQMRFPLDIVWIRGGRVVDIAPNLAPDPATTESDLVVYKPRDSADTVLEVPAGFAHDYGLGVGDSVVFSEGKSVY